jgi:N-acetylneuraminic acid mutarotase
MFRSATAVQKVGRFARRQRVAAATVTPVEPLESRQLFAAGTPALGSLVLYNADNGQPIGPFENNTTINYSALPTRNLSVRATASDTTQSVRFAVDGSIVRTENFAPYSVVGDNDATGLPNPWTPPSGSHTLIVTPYPNDEASGDPGAALNVTFNVTEGTGGGGSVVSGPVVSFSDNTADAAEANLDKGTFVVSRSGSTSAPLNVAYNVSGSATNGLDYQQLSGTITIPTGASSAQLVVFPKDDSAAEGTENVVLTIIAGNGYSVGSPAGATCPIADNDSASTPTPTPTTQGISDITWTRNAPRSPEPRTEAGVLQIGSKIYEIGGFTAAGGTGSFFPLTRHVHVYDMATRTWKQLASLPGAAAGNHAGAATDGKYIYWVAGQTEATYGAGTKTTWRYDIANNSWSQFADLPAIRYGGAAFVANGWLHFVGGDKSDRTTPATDHWAINLSNPSGGWVRKASIPVAADHMSHAIVNGKVYLIGGEHGHEGLNGTSGGTYIQHKNVYAYDPSNDTWTRKADLPTAISHTEGETLVINNRIVVIGGLLDGGSPNQTSRVQVYDPATNTWKTLATRYPKRIIGAVSGYWSGKIYMSDGYSPDENDRQVGFEGTIKFG